MHVDGRCAAVSSTQMRITLGAKVWRKIRKEQKLCKHFRVLYDDDDNVKESKAAIEKEREKKGKNLRNYVKHGSERKKILC